MYMPSYIAAVREYDDTNIESTDHENIDENCVELVGRIMFEIVKEKRFYAFTISLMRYFKFFCVFLRWF